MSNGSLVLVGRISGVFGIKGNVKIRSYTNNAVDIGSYQNLQTQSKKLLSLKILRIVKNGILIAHIKGCNTRNSAEEYINQNLYIPREVLSPLEIDEYYFSDLEQLNVFSSSEATSPLGTIKSIHNYGAGTFLEITLENGKTATILFNKEAILNIDCKKKTMIINENFLIH